MISYHTCPLASAEGKETGGMNVYVLELSKQLARLGVKVDMYTRCQDPGNPEIVEVEPNLRLIHLPAGAAASLSKKEMLEVVPEFVESFTRFVTKHKLSYQVFHAHYYMSGLATEKIQQQLQWQVPMVMTFHTLALMKNLVARDNEQESPERIEVETELMKTAAQIITPSESDMRYMQYLYGAAEEKLVAVPPGVNTQVFKPIAKEQAKRELNAAADQKIILFAGRIEPLKGIDVLMYATKIVLARQPDLKLALWIVGGDVSQTPSAWSKELQKLEQLRRTLNMPESVKFMGQKTQGELPLYYNAAEVVVMASHYESFGMAALEAMACGVPVITTNVSGISSLLDEKHSKLVTSANNPLLLATQIEAVLNNQVDHQAISQSLLSKVQDLDWSQVAARLLKVYSQVANV
jgi:D-inositol-3-phosphate glycosyltransferase